MVKNINDFEYFCCACDYFIVYLKLEVVGTFEAFFKELEGTMFWSGWQDYLKEYGKYE